MMQDRFNDAYVRWTAADQAAKAKEEELRRAWIVFFEAREVAPSDALIHEVSELRKRAGELLTMIIHLPQADASRVRSQEELVNDSKAGNDGKGAKTV